MKNFNLFTFNRSEARGENSSRVSMKKAESLPTVNRRSTDGQPTVNRNVGALLLRLAATLTLLLALGVGQMWAADVQQNAIIYMDNSVAGWDYSNIYFVINNTNGYPMTAIANTKLYVHKRSAGTWSGYSNVRFFAATSSWGGDDASMGSESNMSSYGANLTNTQTNYGFNGNNYYVIKLDKKGAKTSSSTRANLSTSYIGNAYSSLNKTITVKAKVSTDGGSTYSEKTSPGTLSASSKKFTAYNSCASATSLSSGTISCGYTATTTLTAADATGYDFVGWYNSSGTQQTTSKTLTIYPTDAATYYAYYKEKRYNVTATASPAAGGSVTPTSATAMGQITGGSITATPNTGYTFGGWSGGTGTFTNASSASTTFKPTATSTVTATFNETMSTVSFVASPTGKGTFQVSSSTVTSTTAGVTTTKSVTAVPATGYVFGSWSITGGATISSTSTNPTTVTGKGAGAAATLTCTFNPKTYSITLDGNGGSDGSATATYNSSTLTSVTGCSRASYDLNGYYTATSGGTKIINADGSLVASVSGYTNSSSQWIKDANVELHAQWTYNPVTYTVTYAVGTGSTSYGSLSAANTSTSAAISSGSSLESGTGVTFTATPNTHYVVEGWYTNAACTAGKHDAGNTTYSTTLSGNITVYVKFVEKTWSVTFAAGTGGSVSTPASSPQTVGEVTGVSINATVNTGYTFNTWTITNGSGSFTSEATTKSNKFIPTAASTITASFTEKMSTLTTSCKYDVGNPGYAIPTASTSSIGISTTATLTATAASTGYTFAGWTLSSNLVVTSGNAATDRTITVRTTGNGAAATARAEYAEDLSSPYTLKGGTNITGDNWKNAYNFTKKTGHSTESVAYCSFDIAATNSGQDGSADYWSFKVLQGSTWYGLTATGGSYWWTSSTAANQTLSSSGKNIQICANVAGPYEIKLDYSNTSSLKVTVIFPTSYTLTYNIGSVNGTSGTISTSPSIASGASVIKGTSVTLTAPAAKTGYTWKGWYTNAAGTSGKIDDTDRAITVTMNADKTLYACYTEDKYSVTINNGDHGTVSPNGSQNIGVSGLSITATPAAGWMFDNWSKTGTGVSLSSTTTNPTTVTASGTGSVTANYKQRFILRGSTKASDTNTAGLAGWSATDNSSYSSATIAGNVMTITANLTAANTEYKFLIRDIKDNVYKGQTGTGSMGDGTTWTLNGTKDVYFTTTIAGTYTFAYNVSTGAMTITYPTTYTLTYAIGSVVGNDGSITTSPTTASGAHVASGGSVTLTGPAPKTGYSWKGWYTNAAGTTGKITDTNRAITVTMNANKTLYACYTENTFNVKASASPAAGGSVTPTSNTAMGQISGGDITATANTGYTFAGWSIASGSGYFGTSGTSTTSNTANTKFRPTAATTLTASFTENKYSVSVSVASNNTAFGTVSPASVSGVGVATASATITANPKTGATFTGWTLPAGVTLASGTLSSTSITINASAASQTITANFSETKSNVTLNNDDATRGTVNTSSPQSVGQITAVQIQATPKNGYMFAGWVKTSGTGVVTYHVGPGTGQIEDGGGVSKSTTYITVDGNVTLKATWDEDRSSGYFVHYGNDGKNADGGADASMTRAWADGNLYKNKGETTGTVSYWTFMASSADVGKVIEFKVLQGDPSDYGSCTWYGYNSSSGGKITATIANQTLNTSYGNGRMVVPTPGNYVFKWDSNGNKLSITYPAGNYVRGGFNSWGWTNEMSSSAPYTTTIHLPADTYYSGDNGFKYVISGTHYGKNSTTITSAAASASSCSTSGANINLATTIEGDYTFTVPSGKKSVTVTYPTIPAMPGTLGLNVSGARSGDGDLLTPYIIFAGETLTLSPNHTSAPSADDHFKYTYYKGANNASTATTELATKLSTAASTSYGLEVGSTTGKYPLKVSAYYEYGPDGYKAKGTTKESSIVYYRVMLAPAVALTSSKVSIKEGTDASFTLTATPSNVSLASSLIKVSYEFFNGNSTAAANKIGETIQKTDGTAVTQTITPTYNTTTNSWTYTVKMTYLGIEKTATVTVYRKWDIYVDDAASCNWGTMKLYMWDDGGSYPVAFPGEAMPLVTGSTHWHVVTLDTRYPHFKLSKQSGTESGNHTASIVTYPAGTYYYLNSCTTLTKLTLTNPTVTLTASVANCKDITLTGNVSNFGGDGLVASRLKSVKFIVEGSDQAATTVSTTNGTFSVTLTNATAGATNTLQAYAENIYGSAVSGVLRYSNVTLDLDGGTGGTTAVTAVNGMAMPTGATAPTKEGYKFGGYYANKNGGGKQYYSASMASANTWNKPDQNVTIYAKWTKKETYNVYFYNKDNWATPKAYLWLDGSSPLVNNAAWPGEAMTVYQGPVYKLDYEHADGFNRIIFSDNGASAKRTGDLTLQSTNSWFFNPEDSLTATNGWTRYIMVANYPTEKQVAVVGEKKTIDPVVAWSEGVGFNQVNITATRDSGSTAVTATIAGTKIIATSSAAGTAKFSITYSCKGTTITKVVRFQFLEGLTVQAKIDTADAKWKETGKVRIHYWGNLGSDPTGDITMSYLKLEGNEYYFQALVPKGSNGKANFLFFYDYMENTTANKWRQTNDQTNVNELRCYTIEYDNATNKVSKSTYTVGLCAISWQLRIIMGSGDIYTSNSVTSSDDIVSFFAPANKSSDPSYRKGTVSLEYNGATVHTYPTTLVSASGVYTAKINTSTYALTDIAPYTGDYYIRTDPSKGGWDNYKEEASNKLTKFARNTNFPNETFSYYWVDNVAKTSGGSGTVNIKATVANDYNPVLCSFSADENVAREEHGLNLRFGYEPTTNDLIRGILRGATFNDFLNLIGSTGNIYKEITCDTLFNDDFYNTSDNFKGKCKLQDKSNWVYEIIVYAKIDDTHPTADVVLKSYYNGLHYLLGMVKDLDGRDTSTPESFRVINNTPSPTTNGIYGLRVIYDFKTNRLFGAWAPADREVDGILNVDADIMFLRHEFDDVAQIGFKTSNPTTNKITDLNHAIFALEIDNDKKTSLGNRELHYFISLPFDCQVSNIFGIGGYMNYWGIQRYRGDLRAKNGWFQETDSFWEWLTEDDVLEAGEGYLVSIDKKAMQNDGVWKEGIIYQTQEEVIDPSTGEPYQTVAGTDSVQWVTHTDGSLLTMYFPSTTSGFEIKPAAGSELIITYPELECKITRANRNLYDSNWRCLGTPGYKNITINSWDTTGSNFDPDTIPPQFLYEFHEQTTKAVYAPGTYKVVDGSTYTYHSFNSYMVQYAGTINWNVYSKGEGASSPLRRLPRKDATITKLQLDLLNDEGTELDRAFVWLQEEATLGYDKNFDLNKMVDSRLNQIYSLAEHDAPYAANVLPLETDTVALVVNITKAGEFTFSLLKEKHCGLTPILYDMYENVQTNLLADDYTVALKKGKYTGRFFIIFQAGEPVATNFETTSDGGQKVLSDEAIYDVLGRRVDVVYPGLLYIVNGEKRIAK